MTIVSCKAPNFKASAVLHDGSIVKDFCLQSFIKNTIAVIFFWPMDFTFVCPSELIAFNKRFDEFKNRNVRILGISTDSEFVHSVWRKTPIDQGGVGTIKYPMIADINREIINAYGIKHPNLNVALRGTFLIDNKGIIRHQSVNDLPFGRNIDEIIRMVDALIFHEKNHEVCPAQWKVGSNGIKENLESTAKYLTDNFDKL